MQKIYGHPNFVSYQCPSGLERGTILSLHVKVKSFWGNLVLCHKTNGNFCIIKFSFLQLKTDYWKWWLSYIRISKFCKLNLSWKVTLHIWWDADAPLNSFLTKKCRKNYFALDKGNLILCCMGPTDPDFWQIKRILISHTIFTFFYNLYFF